MKIIDVHTHVWLANAEECRRELMEAVERVPLERVYASGLHGHQPNARTVVEINNAVYELLKVCPQAHGQLYLNPRHVDQVMEEFKRCRGLGFDSIKLWVATKANDPLNFPIYEAAIEHGMPVLLHCFEKSTAQKEYETLPWEFAEAARRYPECTFLMAHIAGDFISGTECVVGLDNVYVDPSGSYQEHGMVEYAVERLGAEHVMFGTDMPGSDIYHNLGKVIAADISDEAKELILHKNAERVLP